MLKFHQRLSFLCSIVLLCCLLVLIGCSSHTPPTLPKSQQSDVKLPAAIRYRIILIGDAGEPTADEPVLKTLTKWGKKMPEKTSIVFLGDNMYDDGLTRKTRHEADKKLGPQLAVVTASQAHGLFIPGNHDWANGFKNGYSAVLAQERFINQRIGAGSRNDLPVFLPSSGAPGPVGLDLPTSGAPGPVGLDLPRAAPAVRLVILDTQWWLHKYDKWWIHADKEKDEDAIIDELKSLLGTELPVIIAGHHPIKTYGSHSGKWYKLWSRQDTRQKVYKSMINHLNTAFSVPEKASLLIYAAGHDHSLQVLEGDTTDYLIVSGAGSSQKISEVKCGKGTLFACSRVGFIVIDFFDDDTVLLRAVGPGDKEVMFHHWLKP